MKQPTIMTIVGLSILITAAGVARAQTAVPTAKAENPSAVYERLTLELRNLKSELVQQAIEFQQWKVKHLERELQLLSSERHRLQEEERELHQQIAELSAAGAGASEGVQALKDELTGSVTEELRLKQQPLIQRHDELTEELRQEQRRLQDLIRKAKKPGVEAGGTPE